MEPSNGSGFYIADTDNLKNALIGCVTDPVDKIRDEMELYLSQSCCAAVAVQSKKEKRNICRAQIQNIKQVHNKDHSW